MKMYARLTVRGTACLETALCEIHVVHAEHFQGGPDAVTKHVETTDDLVCLLCLAAKVLNVRSEESA